MSTGRSLILCSWSSRRIRFLRERAPASDDSGNAGNVLRQWQGRIPLRNATNSAFHAVVLLFAVPEFCTSCSRTSTFSTRRSNCPQAPPRHGAL